MTTGTVEPIDYWNRLRAGGVLKPEDVSNMPMWTIRHVADYLQWGDIRLRRRIKSGASPVTRIGDRVYLTQHQFRIAIIAARVEMMAETGRLAPLILEACPDPLGAEAVDE